MGNEYSTAAKTIKIDEITFSDITKMNKSALGKKFQLRGNHLDALVDVIEHIKKGKFDSNNSIKPSSSPQVVNSNTRRNIFYTANIPSQQSNMTPSDIGSAAVPTTANSRRIVRPQDSDDEEYFTVPQPLSNGRLPNLFNDDEEEGNNSVPVTNTSVTNNSNKSPLITSPIPPSVSVSPPNVVVKNETPKQSSPKAKAKSKSKSSSSTTTTRDEQVNQEEGEEDEMNSINQTKKKTLVAASKSNPSTSLSARNAADAIINSSKESSVTVIPKNGKKRKSINEPSEESQDKSSSAKRKKSSEIADEINIMLPNKSSKKGQKEKNGDLSKEKISEKECNNAITHENDKGIESNDDEEGNTIKKNQSKSIKKKIISSPPKATGLPTSAELRMITCTGNADWLLDAIEQLVVANKNPMLVYPKRASEAAKDILCVPCNVVIDAEATRPTLKVLRAMAKGGWILDPSFVIVPDNNNNGKSKKNNGNIPIWPPEDKETFEHMSFVKRSNRVDLKTETPKKLFAGFSIHISRGEEILMPKEVLREICCNLGAEIIGDLDDFANKSKKNNKRIILVQNDQSAKNIASKLVFKMDLQDCKVVGVRWIIESMMKWSISDIDDHLWEIGTYGTEASQTW